MCRPGANLTDEHILAERVEWILDTFDVSMTRFSAAERRQVMRLRIKWIIARALAPAEVRVLEALHRRLMQ